MLLNITTGNEKIKKKTLFFSFKVEIIVKRCYFIVMQHEKQQNRRKYPNYG